VNNDDKSFIFEGVKFRFGTYAKYNYVIENSTEKIMVEDHYRGCICEYKPCIRLCCLESSGGINPTCMKTNELTVPTIDGEEKILNIENGEYAVLTGRPCGRMYKLEPLDYPDDQWAFLKVSFSIFHTQIIYFLKFSHLFIFTSTSSITT
jgi:hypothetical protein